MIMSNSNNLTPTFKLLRGLQACLFPHQVLFVKAIAMLLSKTQRVSHRNLSQIDLWISQPDKPTFTGVALRVFGMRTHNTNDGELKPTRIFHMQLVPPEDLNRTPLGVFSLKAAIGSAIGRRIANLQAIPIFSRGPTRSCWRRSWPVKSTLAFETAKHVRFEATALTPKPVAIIATVQSHNRLCWQERQYLSELC